MDIKGILARCDHTLLAPTATWEEIQTVCDEGIRYGTETVCIPPVYVAKAVEYIKKQGSKLGVCTVVGFPNGYNSTKVKVYETEQAILDGAREIDMVINLGWLKAGQYDDILAEIKAIKAACHGRVLKVIIETSELTQDEKVKMCKLITEAKADYVKTSTGFSKCGATPADIAVLKGATGKGVKIKASGGISSLDDADLFIMLGADRLGTSKVVKLFMELQKKDGHK